MYNKLIINTVLAIGLASSFSTAHGVLQVGGGAATPSSFTSLYNYLPSFTFGFSNPFGNVSTTDVKASVRSNPMAWLGGLAVISAGCYGLWKYLSKKPKTNKSVADTRNYKRERERKINVDNYDTHKALLHMNYEMHNLIVDTYSSNEKDIQLSLPAENSYFLFSGRTASSFKSVLLSFAAALTDKGKDKDKDKVTSPIKTRIRARFTGNPRLIGLKSDTSFICDEEVNLTMEVTRDAPDTLQFHSIEHDDVQQFVGFKANVNLTTGYLIGLSETREEWIASLTSDNSLNPKKTYCKCGVVRSPDWLICATCKGFSTPKAPTQEISRKITLDNVQIQASAYQKASHPLSCRFVTLDPNTRNLYNGYTATIHKEELEIRITGMGNTERDFCLAFNHLFDDKLKELALELEAAKRKGLTEKWRTFERFVPVIFTGNNRNAIGSGFIPPTEEEYNDCRLMLTMKATPSNINTLEISLSVASAQEGWRWKPVPNFKATIQLKKDFLFNLAEDLLKSGEPL